ncbi:hypothetical protein D9758_011039 [Tetrapyrgos nigripes]|uniref:Uncharacterized protein n=1 Tax=Tetrapyrgos nigripes TaxID=182062 RepID=A0A8H5CSM4_9AGAR|nr:hypothetical protein D9758_011039 [Tetrapyrgos nigripes]
MLGSSTFLAFSLSSTILVAISLLRTSLIHNSKDLWRMQKTVSVFNQFEGLRFLPSDQRHYSYEGEDYPNFAPIPSPGFALMSVEETVHYSPSNPTSVDEWLYNSPWGTGTIRLGPRNRTFYLSTFHDLHCLRRMHLALIATPDDDGEWWHLQHCFNVLRQAALCQADMTLEKGDFVQKDIMVERYEPSPRVCRDWEAVYDTVGIDWLRWRRYIKTTNLTGWQRYSFFEESD